MINCMHSSSGEERRLDLIKLTRLHRAKSQIQALSSYHSGGLNSTNPTSLSFFFIFLMTINCTQPAAFLSVCPNLCSEVSMSSYFLFEFPSLASPREGPSPSEQLRSGNCCCCISATQRAIFMFHHVINLNCPLPKPHRPTVLWGEVSVWLRYNTLTSPSIVTHAATLHRYSTAK